VDKRTIMASLFVEDPSIALTGTSAITYITGVDSSRFLVDQVSEFAEILVVVESVQEHQLIPRLAVFSVSKP
jgi:hypothetical protein